MKTFKHSGDLGDIVYALPAIRALGGGVLCLDSAGGESEPACRAQCIDRNTKFNQAGFDFVAPLLRRQPGLNEVATWRGQAVDVNLDRPVVVSIPYRSVADALEMARIITRCQLLVANATLALAVGIGLGHVELVQELERHQPTTYFEGKGNMRYV